MAQDRKVNDHWWAGELDHWSSGMVCCGQPYAWHVATAGCTRRAAGLPGLSAKPVAKQPCASAAASCLGAARLLVIVRGPLPASGVAACVTPTLTLESMRPSKGPFAEVNERLYMSDLTHELKNLPAQFRELECRVGEFQKVLSECRRSQSETERERRVMLEERAAYGRDVRESRELVAALKTELRGEAGTQALALAKQLDAQNLPGLRVAVEGSLEKINQRIDGWAERLNVAIVRIDCLARISEGAREATQKLAQSVAELESAGDPEQDSESTHELLSDVQDLLEALSHKVVSRGLPVDARGFVAALRVRVAAALEGDS